MTKTWIHSYPLNSHNRESSAQFENRIKPWEYVRRITRSTTCEKRYILLTGTGVRKMSSVACRFSPIKIHFSYPKSLISLINEVYVVVVFSIKYRYSEKTYTSFITVLFAAITLVIVLGTLH